MLIINDDNYKLFLGDIDIDGHKISRGLLPRDMQKFPMSHYPMAIPFSKQMDLIPQSEWSDRIKEQEKSKSRLSDIRLIGNIGKPIPSLDQNGQGYCWSYGSVGAVMLLRALQNMPYVRLSAHAVACKIKNFKDEGGWGAQSFEFISKFGVPSVATWPEKSMSRQYNTEATWTEAAKYKITEGFVDLEAAIYDRDLSFAQVATCLLNGIPVVCDFNWWGHCVVAMDLVEVERGSFGVRILNSWSDRWGDLGTAVLQGKKAIPDNAVAPRVTTAA